MNRGEEKVRVHMNVVLHSTMNTFVFIVLHGTTFICALEMSLFVVFFCCCIITLGSLFYLLPGVREREGERPNKEAALGMGVNPVCGRTGEHNPTEQGKT